MYKKVFVDANIFLDLINQERPYSQYSLSFYAFAINQEMGLFTSCDLITTIYYLDSKRDKKIALDNIEELNKTLDIIDFSNQEIAQACRLMRKNNNYKDLEDTMQYVLARKEGCDLIISNDKEFYAEGIPVMSSKEFTEHLM